MVLDDGATAALFTSTAKLAAAVLLAGVAPPTTFMVMSFVMTALVTMPNAPARFVQNKSPGAMEFGARVALTYCKYPALNVSSNGRLVMASWPLLRMTMRKTTLLPSGTGWFVGDKMVLLTDRPLREICNTALFVLVAPPMAEATAKLVTNAE